jgi:RNA polymerase sigma-70 factor (ECF subfamily)
VEGLAKLKFEHRVVIVLKHLENLSYEEISQILGIPEKKVKSRLFTARTMLRDVLAQKGIGPNG